MPNTVTVTTTHDPFTGKSTGTPLVVVQLTPHYRNVMWDFMQDLSKRQHVTLYGANGACASMAVGTPRIGGAVLTVAEACCVMEAADDEVVNTYSTSERNLFAWLYASIHDLNL